MQISENCRIFKFNLIFEPALSSENNTKNLQTGIKAIKPQLRELFNNQFQVINGIIYTTQPVEPEKVLSFRQENVNIFEQTHTITIESKGLLSSTHDSTERLYFYARFLKMAIKGLGLQEIQRKYFNPRNKTRYEKHQLEIWPGYVQKLNKFGVNILINVDMSYKIMRPQTLLNYYNDLKSKTSDRNRLVQELIGMTVMTAYNDKMYRIDDISFDQSVLDKFDMWDRNLKQSSNISFVDYFKKRWNMNISDTTQPMLYNKDKKTNKEIYIPIELCTMTGLTDKQRQDFHLMKDIAQTTKCSGNQRMKDTQGLVESILKKEKSAKLFNEWGIQIDNNPIKINASKLDAGKVIFKNTQLVIEGNNNYERESQQEMYSQPQLSSWGIFYSRQDSQIKDEFMNTMQQSSSTYKYQIDQPQCIEINSTKWEDWLNQLQRVPPQCQLIICILGGPKKSGFNYKEIKQYLTKEKGVACQCICAKTLQGKGIRSICNKILVQMCAKLGGVPWYMSDLPFTDLPTMIIGSDTYHKMQGKSRKSCVAIVATMDRNFSRYWSNFQTVQQGQEIGYNMSVLYKQAVETFREQNKIFPQRIIVFRDGISAGQRQITRDSECTPLRLVLDNLGCQNTKIIYICINKKVDAKFYLNTGSNLDAPKPGTLIDTDVIEGDDDFYLISQLTTQGIPTPSHYHVLVNEFKSEDNPVANKDLLLKLQNLAYKLCYQYYNWNGSIKVPAPIQYAHKLSNLIGDKFSFPDFQPHQNLGKVKSLYFI